METLVGVLVGIGLSAACGFRVFVPLLSMNLAARAGMLDLGGGFDWMSSDAALAAFAMATVLEILGYTVPWLDNVLDGLASPAALVAGTMVMAASVGDMEPFLKWALAVIAGGGAAGVVQFSTVSARGFSSAVSGGLANPAVATTEAAGSVVSSAVAIFVPFLVPVLFLALAWVAVRWAVRRRRTGQV